MKGVRQKYLPRKVAGGKPAVAFLTKTGHTRGPRGN